MKNQPTPSALRAAQSIADRFADGRHLGPPERVASTRRAISRIIERETLLPRLLDMLYENQLAWNGEEESVKEEHAELIEKNAALIEELEAK